MKYQISEIKNYMENWAREDLQLTWDNSGSQIEFKGKTDSLVLGLDVTDKLIKKANYHSSSHVFWRGEKHNWGNL